MSNYVRPSDTVADGTALEDTFQGVIVAITGLPGNLIRPRWQPEPANPPGADIDWIAFGLSALAPQWNAYQHLDPTGENYLVEGSQVLSCNLSFYGPGHAHRRGEFLDGLQIGQNLEELEAAKIKFMEFANPVQVPALFKNQWRLRSDVRVIFNRWVTRTYPIKSILSANGTIVTDTGLSAPISVPHP